MHTSDYNDYKKIVDFVVECFNREFGNDIVLIERTEAFYHMGWFELEFLYVPLKYTIKFENDRNLFVVYVFDEKGAHTSFNRIRVKNKNIDPHDMDTWDNHTRSPEDVKNRVSELKELLERNDFSF